MIFDIIGILFFLLAIIRGYQQGLIRSFFTFTGSFIAVIIAVLLSGHLTFLVSNTMNYEGRWLPALTFLIVFIVVIILVKLISKMVESFVEMAMLGWLNKLAGMSLHLLLSILFLSVVIYLVSIVGSDLQSVARGSFLYKIIKPIAPTLFTFISEHWTSFKLALAAFDNAVQ